MNKLIGIILLFVTILTIGCSTKPSLNTGLKEKDTITKIDMAIGGIYYGQPLSEVFSKFGKPVYTRKGAPNGMCYRFVSNGTEFDISSSADENKSGTIMSMQISGNVRFATSKGIKIGSSYDEVMKAYGKPTVEDKDILCYRIRFHRNPKQHDWYGYLNFYFDKNNKVSSIKFGTVDMSC